MSDSEKFTEDRPVEDQTNRPDPRLEVPDIEQDLGAKQLHDTFRMGVQRLEGADRELVLEHFVKLKDAFSSLNRTMDKILSSEEGRQIFEQEMRKRQDT